MKKSIIKNVIRILLVIAIISWMMIIFGFSAADGEASQSTSDIITEMIIEKFYSNYDNMTIEAQKALWNNISFVVRKTGHFGEYAILSVFVTVLLLTYEWVKNNKKMLIIAVVFCGVYAITDEVHQSFVAGRSPKVMDVCIDSSGAICGTIFVVVFLYVTKVIQNMMMHRTTAL